MLNSLQQLKRIFVSIYKLQNSQGMDALSIYVPAFIIATLPAISSCLTQFSSWGGLCHDAFG